MDDDMDDNMDDNITYILHILYSWGGQHGPPTSSP